MATVAAALKAHYREQLEKVQAARRAEIEQIEEAFRAAERQKQAGLAEAIAPYIPDGVTMEWKYEQDGSEWQTGYFLVEGDERRYAVQFVAQKDDAPVMVRIWIGDRWKMADNGRLAEYIGAEVNFQDEQEAARRAAEAEAAQAAAARARRAAEAEAAEAAEAEKAAAEKAARRAEKLTRRVAEAEAIAAAQAKHLVNPSGLTYNEVASMAQQAIDAATDAAAQLPGVEQLRTEIGVFERQLREAQAAATWGAGGANETERKNAAARALAADPEVKRLQAALDSMTRRLAVIEPTYKAVSMKSGAWRAVAELYAGWLQSLR